jgi:hypothetical protein
VQKICRDACDANFLFDELTFCSRMFAKKGTMKQPLEFSGLTRDKSTDKSTQARNSVLGPRLTRLNHRVAIVLHGSGATQ